MKNSVGASASTLSKLMTNDPLPVAVKGGPGTMKFKRTSSTGVSMESTPGNVVKNCVSVKCCKVLAFPHSSVTIGTGRMTFASQTPGSVSMVSLVGQSEITGGVSSRIVKVAVVVSAFPQLSKTMKSTVWVR